MNQYEYKNKLNYYIFTLQYLLDVAYNLNYPEAISAIKTSYKLINEKINDFDDKTTIYDCFSIINDIDFNVFNITEKLRGYKGWNVLYIKEYKNDLQYEVEIRKRKIDKI